MTENALDALPVWQIGVAFYQARKGVRQPWICEISPMQYTHLSKRARAEYDAKREREWNASGACKDAYAAECLAAYDDDPGIDADPKLHPDAKDAIFWARKRREEAAQRARFEALRRENDITDASQIEIGDRVFWLLGSRYLTITKKRKASARAVDAKGAEYKIAIRACQWLHYNELQEAAKSGATTVKPRRV